MSVVFRDEVVREDLGTRDARDAEEGRDQCECDLSWFHPVANDGREHLSHAVLHGGGQGGGLGTLWKHGISGDRPVVLIKVSRVTGLRLLKSLGEFAGYMEQRLCPVDVAAVGDYPAEYRNELRERMEAMEGIRLIHGYDLAEGEYEALRSAAHLEVDPAVSLNRQFAPKPVKDGEYRNYSEENHPPLNIEKPELEMDNGWGGFGSGGEYVITLEPGRSTPMPWSNVIANDCFGAIITERGGGYT